MEDNKKNVETEQLSEYLKGLSFKKRAFGGLDEEDVYIKIKELVDIMGNSSSSDAVDGSVADEKLQNRIKALEDKLQLAAKEIDKERKLRAAEEDKNAKLQSYIEQNGGVNGSATGSDYSKEMDKLQKLIVSIEGAKDDIMQSAIKDARKERNKLVKDLDGLKIQRNMAYSEFKNTLGEMYNILENISTEANKLKMQLVSAADSMGLNREESDM